MTALLGIELPKVFYSAGEAVKGTVVFQPKTDRKLFNIQLHFTGFEFVENSLLSDAPFQKRWILTGQTVLFGKKVTNLKDEEKAKLTEENDGTSIKEGKYSWPFSFTIPQKIPPSCEYKNGKVKIEYNLVAVVEVPWSKGIRCVQNIRIGLPYIIDPKEQPEPTIEEKHFLLHSHSGVSDNVKHALRVEAGLDKSVTYSGDKINLHVKVKNNSGKIVQGLKLKLKQQWVWGSSNTEKVTVYKMNLKDKAFPLDQTVWEGNIPLVMPNVDLKPTIQNAALIQLTYHITLRAIVKGVGLDLLCKVPVTVASFKPLIKGVDDKKEEKKEEPKKEEKKDDRRNTVVEPLINLMDIDVPVAAAALPPPIGAPVGASADPFGTPDMFAKVQPSEASVVSMEYSKIQSDINQNITDLDTAVSWASTGHLKDAVEIPKDTTIESAQNELVNAAKELFQFAAELATNAKGLKGAETVEAAKKLSGGAGKFTERTKISSIQVPEHTTQSEILTKGKSILLAVQDTVQAGRDITHPEIGSDQRSQEQALVALNASIKAIGERLQDLLKYSQQSLAATHKRIQEMVETKATLSDAFQKFSNPFDAPANDKATLNDVRNSALQYKKLTSQFVINIHGSQQSIVDQAKQITNVTRELLSNISGVAKKNENISKQLKEEGKFLGLAANDLLASATVELKQGHAHKELKDADSSAQVHSQTVIDLTSVAPAPVNDIEKGAADELEKAVQALLKASEALQKVKKETPQTNANPFAVQAVDHRWEVIGSAGGLTDAIRELLAAAAQAQSERADWARTADKSVYHRDETWIDGLISAAQQVVILINKLVEMLSSDKWEETEVISILKQIGASIAQLVSAQKAKGDPNSESHRRLLKAAKLVTQSIDDVVKSANNSKQATQENVPAEAPATHMTDYKIKEFQKLTKIQELEKALESERQNLARLRKDQYQPTGNTPKQPRKQQEDLLS